jgi:hypothetical protein
MIKRHTFWLKTAVVFLFLSAVLHSVALVTGLTGETEDEKKVIALMSATPMQTGDGFNPTIMDLFTALSSCYTWLYLFGAMLFVFLLRKNVASSILRGVTGIGIIIYGAAFIMIFTFAFLGPILFSGLSLLPLMIAYFLFPKTTE